MLNAWKWGYVVGYKAIIKRNYAVKSWIWIVNLESYDEGMDIDLKTD